MIVVVWSGIDTKSSEFCETSRGTRGLTLTRTLTLDTDSLDVGLLILMERIADISPIVKSFFISEVFFVYFSNHNVNKGIFTF